MRVIPDLIGGAASIALTRLWPIHRPHILIAAMPKSASSFLTYALGNLPGMSRTSITYSSNGREHVIDLPRIAKRSRRPFVAQHHIQYSPETGAALDYFRVLPVVTTRDIFDTIVSLRDHFRTKPTWLWQQFSADLASLPDHRLEEMIADQFAPWYLQFFASWTRREDALWIAYDDIFAPS